MLELGVIELSKRTWASPTVPVRKFDGELRICIDYRRLNNLTKKDPYRMPLVEELIDEVGNASFLSKIDLVKVYYQIPMEESSKEKTAFVCPFVKYQLNRMPFGLSNAPATFQRVMDKMLSGATEFAKTYIDDIVVLSACWRDHLTHLEEVLKRLKDAGLTANHSKCDWGKSEREYLGHVVGSGKTSVPQVRVADLRNFKRPGKKKQLKSFLGLVGFYRRFIQDFGKLAQPLYSAIKREMCEQVQWTDQMQESFCKLCNVLSNHCMLYVPCVSDTFVVECDASYEGIGAVLYVHRDGRELPVGFHSRPLRELKHVIRHQKWNVWQWWTVYTILKSTYKVRSSRSGRITTH